MKKRLSLFLAAFVVAAFGIVAFSSFKGSDSKPVVTDYTFYLPQDENPSSIDNWSDQPISEVTCGVRGEFCSISFTAINATPQQVLTQLLLVYTPGSNASAIVPVTVGSENISVQVTEKAD